MNEQYPTADSASPRADSYETGLHGGFSPAMAPAASTVTDSSVEWPSAELGALAPNTPELAQMQLPPPAQPLLPSALTGLGVSPVKDSWEEAGAEPLRTLANEASAAGPLSALPLPSFSPPDPIDAASRLTAPLALPSLPSIPFPGVSQSIEEVSASGTPLDSVVQPASSLDPAQSLPPIVTSWEPLAPSSNPSPAPTAAPAAPNPPAFPALPSFSNGPAFAPAAAFATDLTTPISPLTAPAFPSAPTAFEAPTFPSAPPLPAAPLLSDQQALDQHAFAPQQPFDAGDSFAPATTFDFQLSDQTPSMPLAASAATSATTSPHQFSGPVDFSSNPLPRPEALVVRPFEEPTKKSRFGRKKQTSTDLLSVIPTSAAAVAPALSSVSTKAKRFGKKPVQTVDLLGAPLGARSIEAADTSPNPGATSIPPSALGTDFAVEQPSEPKQKRKLFATVDRSKEKPLTPNSGRSRKLIQGLAAVSLLAGAGLFTLSFLDKKSPTPGAPVETPVQPTIALDPSATSVAPAPEADPQAPLDPNAAVDATPVPSVDPVPTVDSVPALPAVDAVDPIPAPTDAIPVSDTAPATDTQAPVTTIAPGPDDLEFSSGGNFSE